MPEGIGEQSGVELTPEQFMSEFGFKSLAEAKAAMSKYKADLVQYKGEAKTAKELSDKLAALEAAEKQRKDAELTEVQKLSARIAEQEKQMQERDARIAAKDREILTERVFSQKLSGKAPEEAAVLRRLLSSAVAGQTFADEAELAELLKPAETEFEAFRAKMGASAGPGIGQAGAPSGSPAAASAARDFLNMPIADKLRAFAPGKS